MGQGSRRLLGAVLAALLLAVGPVLAAPAASAAPCTQTDPIQRKYCELGGAA